MMKIGDEVLVHGYVDEIRNDVVIIRNDGGYFGTLPKEIRPEERTCCRDCRWYNDDKILSCSKYSFHVQEDDWCSKAERRFFE